MSISMTVDWRVARAEISGASFFLIVSPFIFVALTSVSREARERGGARGWVIARVSPPSIYEWKSTHVSRVHVAAALRSDTRRHGTAGRDHSRLRLVIKMWDLRRAFEIINSDASRERVCRARERCAELRLRIPGSRSASPSTRKTCSRLSLVGV